ncbi:caspase, EACC1-associated type [Actinomadura nitritigenes]|uniref:caspase, EACC1-associated type n=1 Tax=Actinomadura nitritigenes TaxID=134602 RepID=UPI003D8AE8C9
MLPDSISSRAVLIGTSKYDRLPELPGVEGNIRSLSTLLQDRDLCGLPPEHCVAVLNPETPSEMVDPIAEAAEEAKDVLFVYFAGHGLPHSTGNSLYLGCVGSDRKRMYRSVAYDHIRDELRESSAKRIIVVLDCCYSGRALNTMSSADDATESLAESAAVYGTYLMASTAENKTAAAGSEFTVFTGQLIDLIDQGIEGEGEFLTVDAIFDATRVALEEQGFPTPLRREKGYGADLAIFRNRAYFPSKKNVPNYGRILKQEGSQWFPDRRSLHDLRVHRPLQAGICGTADNGGAESIVVSGGYKDDEDYGDVIIYTGHGGRDPNTKQQVEDQKLTDTGNAALIQSVLTGMPVRVIRGAGGRPEHSPTTGYSYDGLFVVKQYWMTPSLDGPRVLKFRLEKLSDSTEGASPHHLSRPLTSGLWAQVAPGEYTDRLLEERVKRIYSHACQVCDETLEIPAGLRFASVVHIKSIELPHRGPDIAENMLCLCSNHRDLFVYGALIIDDDLTVIDQRDDEEMGVLTVKHEIDPTFIKYHREHHRVKVSRF